MKFYYRYVTKRVAINKYGKLGFRKFMEVVLTDDITPFNYRKQIKFYELRGEHLSQHKKFIDEHLENIVQSYEVNW